MKKVFALSLVSIVLSSVSAFASDAPMTDLPVYELGGKVEVTDLALEPNAINAQNFDLVATVKYNAGCQGATAFGVQTKVLGVERMKYTLVTQRPQNKAGTAHCGAIFIRTAKVTVANLIEKPVYADVNGVVLK